MPSGRHEFSPDPQGAPDPAHHLASVGRIAAGVAHEVNTHIQVISDSLHFLADPGADAGAPEVAARALDSVNRITLLVRSLKEFAQCVPPGAAPADVNHLVRSTVEAARNEYKYVADVVLDLAEAPPVNCVRADVCHAVLDMVVDATRAIEDAAGPGTAKGLITVRTRQDADHVVIAVSVRGAVDAPDVRATDLYRLPIDVEGSDAEAPR